MTERSYNLNCGSCPNSAEWEPVTTGVQKSIGTIASALALGENVIQEAQAGQQEARESGDIAAQTAHGKDVDTVFDILAGEATSRATFEADVARIEQQDCVQSGCRLRDFLLARDAYAKRGKQILLTSMANYRDM